MRDMEKIWLDQSIAEDQRLRLALLKENGEYRAFWTERADKSIAAFFSIDVSLPAERKIETPEFIEAQDFIVELTRFGIDWPPWVDDTGARNFLHIIDPFSEEPLPDPLPFRVFLSQVPPIAGLIGDSGEPSETRFRVRNDAPLRPSERLLRVDLSRKRGELLREFSNFLDRAEGFKKGGDCPDLWKENYQQWDFDKSRREGTWQALEVWKLRMGGKTFPEIADIQGIRGNHKEDTPKKRFYTVFRLITGRPYKTDVWKTLFFERLEKIALSEGKDDPRIWAKLLKRDTGCQGETIPKVKENPHTGEKLDIRENVGSEGDIQQLLWLIRDIKVICEDCPDMTCQSEMLERLSDMEMGDMSAFEDFRPECPKIYNYLTS